MDFDGRTGGSLRKQGAFFMAIDPFPYYCVSLSCSFKQLFLTAVFSQKCILFRVFSLILSALSETEIYNHDTAETELLSELKRYNTG